MLGWRKHFDGARLVTLEKAQTLFRREEAVSAVYLVVSGAVSLERVLPNGDMLILNTARAGDLLAEASLFTPRYHCDAKASVPTLLRALPKAALLAHLAETPETLMQLLTETAHEVQRLRSRIEILRLKRVSERLDAWLALNAAPETGKWVEVADMIGVSPPALYRELALRK